MTIKSLWLGFVIFLLVACATPTPTSVVPAEPTLTSTATIPPPTKTPTPPRTETVPQADAAPVVEHLVWAIYYPWYMESFYPRAWSSEIWTDRPLIPHESDDPDGIRQHIVWAKSAGIDGFLVEWCGIGRPGDNDVLDHNLGTILDVADELDFKIAAYFDRLCIHETDIELLKQQLKYLLTVRAQHPAYYWMNGRPLVVMYDTDSVPLGHWVNIFDTLAEEGLSATYVGESYDANQLSVFSGLHRYVNFDEGNLSSLYTNLERRVDRARLDVPEQVFFWAATVTPGFDNTPIYLGRDQLNPGMSKSDILIKDRNRDQTYRNAWELAIQSGADWIIITSWNEWQENTHIEPSQYYSDSFLLLTKTFIEMWKSVMQ